MRRTVIKVVCCVVAAVALTVVAVRERRQASGEWTRFSIGPASGESTSINTATLRADGVTLKVAVATAYGVPPVRVIGPPWLSETRYSINAEMGTAKTQAFRPLLQEELNKRLGLETHVEIRPFEVFVLTAAETPHLDRASGDGPSTWISGQDVRMQGVSPEGVASALQSILGRPVIDETGLTGSYDLQFGWGEERLSSVTATLRDRFGLRLSADTRNMEALIVDRIWRDPELVILAHVGRMMRWAPAQVRQRIAGVLSTH